MSTQTSSKKRKSVESSNGTAKKVKMVKSAEKPAPLRSALKKTKLETSSSALMTEPTKITKKVAKSAILEKPVNDEDEANSSGDEGGSTVLTADQTAALLAGFSSDEEDSSEHEAGIPLSSLPQAPTADTIKKSIKQASTTVSDPETTPGVIYLGRIPHGFYEPQMRAYFSQFGEISHLRLARNRKTGRSQHHAFIEFASAAVADIVAKTMDKYLLFGHILQARRVPAEMVKEGLFKGGRWKRPAPRNAMERRQLRGGASREVWERRVEAEMRRREAKAEKLRELGYEFEVPVLRGVESVPVRDLEDVDDGVKLVEEGEPATVVETVQIVRDEPEEGAVVEEKVTTKRKAGGKVQVKETNKVKKAKA